MVIIECSVEFYGGWEQINGREWCDNLEGFGLVDDWVRAALVFLGSQKHKLRQVERVFFAHSCSVITDGKGLNIALKGLDMYNILSILLGIESTLLFTWLYLIDAEKGKIRSLLGDSKSGAALDLC